MQYYKKRRNDVMTYWMQQRGRRERNIQMRTMKNKEWKDKNLVGNQKVKHESSF
jgi:hypothetical protein